MTSVLAAQPTDFKPSLPVSPASSTTMAPAQDGKGSPPPNLQQEIEPERGRRRSRSDGKDLDGHDNDHGDDGQANSSNSDGPARKRRRSRKGLDKKFECPWEGCGKSYSRAEHL